MKKKEFRKRRKNLLKELDQGVAIINTNPHLNRNRDCQFPFRPDSDFYYLTGFPEPEAVAVLIPEREEGEFVLFCRPRDPLRETWDGRRAGPEGACRNFDADQAFDIGELDQRMPELLRNRQRIYYGIGKQSEFDSRVMSWVNELRGQARAGVQTPSEFITLDHLLHEHRLFKSAAEIETMRTAGKITAAAHVRAMQSCKPGMMEYQLEAEIHHEFMRNGARWPAYNSIVGSGANSCILHYTENDQKLRNGDLVLIDAGAEFDFYAADITRTFPVNGRFSGPQRAIYDLVLEAQFAAIEAVVPNNHWNQPHEAAQRVIVEGLIDLGILHGSYDEQLESGDFKRFFMHRTGHWLGMDVHDVGDYKIDDVWRQLEPGMVTTVEPGIYIAAGSEGVDESWWDIGVRIEDDAVVTAEGCEIITGDVPKQADDIEALMRG